MKNELLEKIAECFDFQYKLESTYLEEIQNLNIEKTIENLSKEINKRLNVFNLELFEVKGVAYNKNEWCVLFICEKNNYTKIVEALEKDDLDLSVESVKHWPSGR
jgi:hypothetical protein